MKKVIFSLMLCWFMTNALCAQHRADQQSLSNPKSFSFILLGDPQGYTKYDINQPLFELCTAWIADNVKQLNIKAVLCTGDLVECDECISINRNMVNQTSRQMWEAASKAMGWLDNKVPYIISCGNHDYGYRSSENGKTHFPEYFPFERNSKWSECLFSDFPNRNGVTSLENAAFRFDNEKLVVISTEFAPRDEVLAWAKGVADNKDLADYKVIVITHSFLRERTAERTANEGYKITPRNYGQDMWEKLVRCTPNIRLVICGHTGHPAEFEDAVAYRVDKNDAGRDVHQMMFNTQFLGGGWEGNGGDGWLRILEFLPDGKTIKVSTYSPLFGISPATKHLAHRTGACDQFDMVIE